MKVKLTTQQQIADKANEIDYNLSHKEEPRFSFWFRFTKNIKEFKLKIKF